MSLRMAAWYESGRSSAGLASPCWSCSYEDALGRTICETRPGFRGSLLVTSNEYNTANQLVATRSYSLYSPGSDPLRPLGPVVGDGDRIGGKRVVYRCRAL